MQSRGHTGTTELCVGYLKLRVNWEAIVYLAALLARCRMTAEDMDTRDAPCKKPSHFTSMSCILLWREALTLSAFVTLDGKTGSAAEPGWCGVFPDDLTPATNTQRSGLSQVFLYTWMEPNALNEHLTHPTSGYPDPETEVSWLLELCPQELEEGTCNQVLITLVFKKWGVWGAFSNGPVAKTSCSQCRGLRFNPLSGR